MKCKFPNCDSTELVYSGTDAFMLGVPTETYCYPCANHIKLMWERNEAPSEH